MKSGDFAIKQSVTGVNVTDIMDVLQADIMS